MPPVASSRATSPSCPAAGSRCAAAQRGDRRTVRAQAHALIEASALLGRDAVAAHSRRLATGAGPGGPLDDEALRALVAEHDAACAVAEADLRQWLHGR